MIDEAFHLTPLDVRRYDFGRAFRGYNRARVDQFRDQVAEEMERLTRINQDLDSKARSFHEQLRAFRERDKALNDALIAAQQLRGEVREQAEREAQLQARGLMNRLFGRWMGSIKHARQLFFVGFVFGISFDTATEVLLLAGTAAAATQGLPFYAVLALPLLFAGGLTLFDSFDGFFMNTAYGWAFARPVRKVYYNLTITALSVAVAFLIGGIEIVGLLSSELHLHGWFGDAVSRLDLNTAGYLVVGLFLVVWVVALAVWRFGRIEARWEAAALAGRSAGKRP